MWSVACKNDNSALVHCLILSPYPYYNSFSEHNPETIRNVSMILGGFIEKVNAECHMHAPYPYLNSFLEHNSAAVRNFLMIFGRNIEELSAKCHMQE